MRLFLLLAFAFALISIALVVSQHPSFVEQTRQLIGTSTSRNDDEAVGVSGWGSQFEHTTTIHMQNDSWQALSGFPSFVKLSFPLPRKAELVDGRLRLQLHTQMAQSGVGSVRVAVNDERRAEVVLNPGQEQRSLLLALTPEDLARAHVTVSLSAHGDTFQGVCPSRPARGVVVDILSSSGIELAHAEPLEDPLDIWLAHGRTSQIQLGSQTGEQDQADQLLLAARLRQASVSTGFVAARASEPAAGLEDNESNFSRLSVNREQEPPLIYEPGTATFSFQNPNTLEKLLVGDARAQVSDLIKGTETTNQSIEKSIVFDTGAQSFFRNNRWRVEYDLVEMERGRAPSRLQLALKMAEQLPGAEWLINVSLNDTLLSSDRLENTSALYTNVIQLPAAAIQAKNEIVIDLMSTQDESDSCDPGLEMTAQLLPDSKLEGVAFLTPEMPVYLIQALARSNAISLVSQDAMSAAQASSSADMLASILPKGTPVNGVATNTSEEARIEVLTKAGLEQRLKMLELDDANKKFWIVSQEIASGAGHRFNIIPLTPRRVASDTLSLVESAAFLLIEARQVK